MTAPVARLFKPRAEGMRSLGGPAARTAASNVLTMRTIREVLSKSCSETP
jgi:hypothetical protein